MPFLRMTFPTDHKKNEIEDHIRISENAILFSGIPQCIPVYQRGIHKLFLSSIFSYADNRVYCSSRLL